MTDVHVERLQEYTPEDAAGIGRLMPFLSDKFSGEPIDQELLETIINSPYHDQIVARLEGRIVGAATLSLVIGAAAGRKGYLEDFIADPAIQQQGVGTKIWQELLTWCKEREVDLSFTSHPSRKPAHDFYRSRAKIYDTTVFKVDVK
jgi:GNAT superfamily N-acetyltransferase